MAKIKGDDPIELPHLSDYERFYFDSWSLLSRARASSGFGVSPITYTDMLSFCLMRGISDLDEIKTFEFFIIGMEETYSELFHEKLKSDAKG